MAKEQNIDYQQCHVEHIEEGKTQKMHSVIFYILITLPVALIISWLWIIWDQDKIVRQMLPLSLSLT